MDLQISVFLLFIFFTAGHSLNCYVCISATGSCEDQKVMECPERNICLSSTTIYRNSTKYKVKGCSPLYACVDTNFNSGDVSISCCSTDLCNAKDAPEPSENSGPNALPYFTQSLLFLCCSLLSFILLH